MLPAQPNQSLIDGLACLQAVAAADTPLGVRELSRQLELEPTRVNRLLKTLAHLGMTEQDQQRKYRTGPGIHVLAAQSLFASGLLRKAAEQLENLRSLGHIVALGVLWRDQVSYLYHAEPGISSVQGVARTGLFPATSSSIGMALLAQLTNAQVRALYRGHDIPSFASGIDTLLDELTIIRQQGFAQAHIGGHTLSLGVTIPRPATAAIAISGRIAQKDIASLVQHLKEAANQIAAHT